MNPTLPWKVIKTPLPLGVCSGFQGEVVHECEAEATARALMYETQIEDHDTVKGIYYTYDVVEWPVLLFSQVSDPTSFKANSQVDPTKVYWDGTGWRTNEV